jgi:hypothetical protein
MARQKRKIKLLKQRRHLNTIILFVLAVLFSSAITEIGYFLYKIQYIKTIDVKFEIGNKLGFALGSQVLDFGIIPPGSSATRLVTMVNEGRRDLLVQIASTKEIKKFVSYKNNFILKANETKQISFAVSVPKDTPNGKYSGKIFMIFKKT